MAHCKTYASVLIEHYQRSHTSDWHETSNGDARQEDDSPAANGDGDRHMNEKQVKRAIENIAKVSGTWLTRQFCSHA